jgi:hypothetical protein
MNKFNTFELIISERVVTVDGEGLFTKVTKFVEEFKADVRIIAMKEQGTEKKLWHTHMIMHFPQEVMKKTTVRSRIKAFFGKCNDEYDWKYRMVRKEMEDFFIYIFKDGNVIISRDFDNEIYEKYKGRYKPKKEYNTKDYLKEIEGCVKRCKKCIEWNEKFCKEDAFRS